MACVSDNKLYAPEFGIFEIAKVIDGRKPDGSCNERKRLGIALFSRIAEEKTLYFRLRDMLACLGRTLRHEAFTFEHTGAEHAWQHPKNTVSVSFRGTALGSMSALHPLNRNLIDKKAAVVFAEIDMDALSLLDGSEIAYAAPSKFPGIDIDLTFTAATDVPYAELEAAWKALECEFLAGVRLVGIYESGDSNAVTVRFTFVSEEKTLTRAEVTPYVDAIVAALDEKGIRVRTQEPFRDSV